MGVSWREVLQMRRIASAIVIVILGAGCATPSGQTPSFKAPASTTPSAAIPPTAPATATPAPTFAACPSLDTAMSVATYFEALGPEPEEGASRCFNGQDVTLLGWADAMPGIGFTPPGIAPGWLWGPTGALWDGDCDQECASLWIHIDPTSGLEWDADGRWVLVTGHTGDPLAETCRWVYPDDWTESPLPVGEARDQCQGSFVVSSVHRAPNAP
jgi:hypothetical protein